MGSIHSYMSSELTLAVVASGLLAFGYVQYTKQLPLTKSVQPTGSTKKGKKKKQVPIETIEETSPTKSAVVSSPSQVPGSFATDTASVDTDAALPKAKKPKKKKGKKAAVGVGAGTGDTLVPEDNQSDGSSFAGESSRQPPSGKRQSFNPEQDEAWTRVESRRRQKPLIATLEINATTELTSDAGVTTSVTGNSSPVTERTEDEGPLESCRTLAEKMLPKSRKTGADDMLETPDYPTVSRVMRVQPRPGEKPAPGFSWADYEDVHVAAEDADGENDGGWGVVKSRGRSRPDRPQEPQQSDPSSSTAETKRQRQNAVKREAQKAAKANAETERLATLARHRAELEKARIAEQYASKSSKKSPSASASVDDRGHLVWD